jgi:hypothetical protein
MNSLEKAVFEVSDFASDALVKKLLSATNIVKVMRMEHVNIRHRQVLAISLIFLNMLSLATNGEGLTRVERISFKYSALIWFLSIDKFSITTKRNMMTCVVGMIFLFARDDIYSFRACTEEILEHIFGWIRQMEKEVTMAGFVNWADRMQAFFAASARSGLSRGGKNAKGYMATFEGFRIALIRMLERQKAARVAKSDRDPLVFVLDQGVTLKYGTDAEPVAFQLWPYIQPILKSVRKCTYLLFLIHFLQYK